MHHKRLITVFDEIPDIVLFDNDVILTNNVSYSDTCHKIIYVTDNDILDKNVTLLTNIQKAFSFLPGTYQVLHNSIYHILLRPIMHVLAMISRVIKQEKIEEIWLFGGSETALFSLSNAEGEGKKRFYHSSWLYNSIINQFFSSDENISVVWHKRKNRFVYALLFWCREHYNYYRRALGYIMRDIRGRTNSILLNDENEKIIIALADLELQYKHLSKQLEKINSYGKLYVLGRSVKPAAKDVVCRLPSLSLLSIIGIIKRINGAKARNTIMDIRLNDHSIKLPADRILMGSKERLFIALYQEKSLSQLIHRIGSEKIHCVCTNRTMGADICYVQNVCKEHHLLHVNLQYVAMIGILYPQMDVADRYYLYNRNVYELYKAYGEQFKYYLPLDTNCFDERNNQARSIVIFTQPDMYTDRYLAAIRAILTCFQENNSQVEIIIKLHYRQDKIPEFISCKQYYRYTKVLTTGYAGDVMSDCDCVISMTSSVLFEALLRGIPSIVLDFDGVNKEVIGESGVCIPEVNYVVHSPYEIINLINNYSLFWREYQKRLEVYLKNNNAQTNIVDDLCK